jgi:hypothetical protein
MVGQEFSGDSLLQALEKDELTPPSARGVALVGMIKRSDESGCVSFTPAGCDAWVDVPTSLIENAVHLGERPCDDHRHPVFRLTLKEPADPEGRLLATLLMTTSRQWAAGSLLKPRGRWLPPHTTGKTGTAASIVPQPAPFDCDVSCQRFLKLCIEDTPFSSALCAFLYSQCFYFCTWVTAVGGIILE